MVSSILLLLLLGERTLVDSSALASPPQTEYEQPRSQETIEK